MIKLKCISYSLVTYGFSLRCIIEEIMVNFVMR